MEQLTQRIASRLGITVESAPRSNRSIVLALREDIQQAIEDGWSILAIYQTLHDEGMVVFSYQTFRRYVNRIFLSKVDAKRKSLKIY